MKENTRICVIAMVLAERENAAPKVNSLLSQYGEMIVGRFGIPCKERGVSVISVVVEASSDEIGAITGKLGQIDGVQVKSITV